jgi:hypothetical protein
MTLKPATTWGKHHRYAEVSMSPRRALALATLKLEEAAGAEPPGRVSEWHLAAQVTKQLLVVLRATEASGDVEAHQDT